MTNPKVAMVTGSSSGIGRQIAINLASAGYEVIIHGRSDSASLQETKRLVETAGGQALTLVGDFSAFQEADFNCFADDAFQLANGRLCAWVNNAGADVLTGMNRELAFAQKLDLLFQVDVRSTLLLSRNVAQKWSQSDDPSNDVSVPKSIVNIGWDQAVSGLPGDSGQMFAASKGAIMAMTGSLAQTYANAVRINCVAPGWIKTQWGENSDPDWDELVCQQSCMGRWGNVDDVASAVEFLLSSKANFVNGQILNVNGGLKTASKAMAAKLK